MFKNLEKWLDKNVQTKNNPVPVTDKSQTKVTDKNPSGKHSGSFRKKFRRNDKNNNSHHPRDHHNFHPAPLPPSDGSKKMRVIPLGGVEGVGEKNMFAIEFDSKILLIDMGWAFPDETLPGIDYIIPDVSYLKGKEKSIVGVVFTHGHMDHIGAVPWLMPKLGYPTVYAMHYTAELIRDRLREFPETASQVKIQEFKPQDVLQLGPFKIGFFRVAHNIADGVGMAIRTEAGLIMHTGDYKFDHTPADGHPTDIQRMAYFGSQGVDLLIVDTTGAEREGYSISEKTVGENLEKIIENAPGRVILTTFSGLLSRHQQVISAAEKFGRKIFLSGRSMLRSFELAQRNGYLRPKPETIHDISNVNRARDKHVIIITTGSQGEPRSALQRVVEGVHPHIKIKPGDTVVFSNSIVPGNERSAAYVENRITEMGANVIYSKMMDIHASGHAYADDIKLTFALVRPKYIMPFHGESRMVRATLGIARSLDFPDANFFITKNGSVVEIGGGQARVLSQRVPVGEIYIDGLGVGDVGTQILNDRKRMTENGIVVVVFNVNSKNGQLATEPEIVSRGFVFKKASSKLLQDSQKIATEAYEKSHRDGFSAIRDEVIHSLTKLFRKQLNREPLIVPTVIKVQ